MKNILKTIFSHHFYDVEVMEGKSDIFYIFTDNATFTVKLNYDNATCNLSCSSDYLTSYEMKYSLDVKNQIEMIILLNNEGVLSYE